MRPVNTNSRTQITINNEPLKVIDDFSQDNSAQADVLTQPPTPVRDSVTSGSATPTASKQRSDGTTHLSSWFWSNQMQHEQSQFIS